MTRFQKLAIVTTTATFLLIGLGGFVRAAGAGLGCPDWPKCFDRWIPPTAINQLPPHIEPSSFNFRLAWIEYINRLVGIAIGILIVATAGLAWLDHRECRKVLLPALLTVPLVGFQGWFGGQVVAYELDPRFVTVHLLVAIGIIALLITATSHSFPVVSPILTVEKLPEKLLIPVAYIVISVVSFQILLGALVRGSIDMVAGDAQNIDRGSLLNEIGWVDDAHRFFGSIVIILCAILATLTVRGASVTPTLKRLVTIPLAFSVIQFTVGIGLAYLALPPSLQVAHVLCASLLIGSLLLYTLQLRASYV